MDHEHCRRYVAMLSSTMELGDNPMDVSDRTIRFEVEARALDDGVIGCYDVHTPRPDCSFRVGPSVASDFNGAVRKYANFAGDFTNADLADVVCRLTRGIAAFAATGVLTPAILNGGRAPRVVVLGATQQPVVAGTGSIFLSRASDSATSPNTFTALVHAAAGSGSRIVTDYCAVNQNGAAIIPTAADGELAHGCYSALRIIGSNYDRAGVGAVFAYAVTRGVHKQVSVVGHTDEGGYMRDVLRTNGFAPSYGGIDCTCRHYTGLPRKDNFDQAGARLFTDTLALVTAGAVAACDPLVQIDGRLYPTVSSAKNLPRGLSGEAADIDEDDVAAVARHHGRSIAQVSAIFAKTYLGALATIFSTTPGAGPALRHLNSAFAAMGERRSRHLEYAVVAPFFWIEPTGVCKLPRETYPAVAAGFGQLTELGVKHVMPCFERMYKATPQACDTSSVVVGYRTARTSGLIQHLVGHRLDGLANLIPQQLDESQMCLTGGDGTSVREKLNNNRDLAAYLWVRGQSPLSAPAECTYAGKAIRLQVRHATFDHDTWDVMRNHVPTLEQMASGAITFVVTQLTGVATGRKNVEARNVRRARNMASDAISLARARVGADLRPVPRGVVHGDCDIGDSHEAVVPGLVVQGTTGTVRDEPAIAVPEILENTAVVTQSEAAVAVGARVPAVTLMTPGSGMVAPAARAQARGNPVAPAADRVQDQ